MIKLVAFDLDDTLYPESEYIKSGYKYVANIISGETRINANTVYEDLITLYLENPKYVFNRFFEARKIEYDREIIQRLVNEYRCHSPEINFYDDVVSGIEELKALQLRLAIITDGFSVAQREKIKALHVDSYFDEIVVTGELGNQYHKPHPRAFQIVNLKLGIPFDEMIYVGDNPEKDFFIGSILPIKTVRINRGGVYKDKEYLGGVRENVSVETIRQVVEYVIRDSKVR